VCPRHFNNFQQFRSVTLFFFYSYLFLFFFFIFYSHPDLEDGLADFNVTLRSPEDGPTRKDLQRNLKQMFLTVSNAPIVSSSLEVYRSSRKANFVRFERFEFRDDESNDRPSCLPERVEA
jgi:hypothetical protein